MHTKLAPALTLLLILYFVSRCVNLLTLPAFVDETGHIAWIQAELRGGNLGVTST